MTSVFFMKTIKDFFISFSVLCLAACVLTSCKATTMSGLEEDAEKRADDRADKKTSGRSKLYKGTAFTIMIPAEMQTNRKQTEREIIHYFFTPEMAHRKVGMGIYEGVAAKSMVRMRKDLIEEESTPAELGSFVGNVQRGVTFKGKRWSEYFLFPKESNFTLQIWWFDVDPDDEVIFRNMIRSIRGIYPKQERDRD
jgi:hypothetical protein